MAALYCLGVGALSCDNPVTNGKISPGFGWGLSCAGRPRNTYNKLAAGPGPIGDVRYRP